MAELCPENDVKTKIHTLEVQEQIRSRGKLGVVCPETIVEVDFDLTGFIYDIRVYSEYFQDFVSVNEAWLLNNFPAKLATLKNAVEVEVDSLRYPKKQFNNDDIA